MATKGVAMGKSKRRLKKRLKKQRNRGKQRKSNQGKFPGRNRHHLTPKSRGGNKRPGNLLLIDIEKHRCWHTMFKNRTLNEVIELLLRIRRLKQGQGRK